MFQFVPFISCSKMYEKKKNERIGSGVCCVRARNFKVLINSVYGYTFIKLILGWQISEVSKKDKLSKCYFYLSCILKLFIEWIFLSSTMKLFSLHFYLSLSLLLLPPPSFINSILIATLTSLNRFAP